MMNSWRNRPKDPLDHEPEAVTYARRQAGLTRKRLAELCGVSPSLITEIEAGTRNATPAMIIKLARALNCPRVVLERKRSDEWDAPSASEGEGLPVSARPALVAGDRLGSSMGEREGRDRRNR